MKYRYAVHSGKGKSYDGKPGRHVNPETWCTGPDPIRHDKYYGYLKHRAQARFRKEDHTLTWEDWENLWPDHLWIQRGRSADNLCLQQIEAGEGWHSTNIEIVTRKEHLQKKRKREIGNE